jgi:hypothetical protein
VGIVGAVFLSRLIDHRARMLEERGHFANELVQHGEDTFSRSAKDYVDAAFIARQRPPPAPADAHALGEGAAALSELRGRVEPKRMAAIEGRLVECEGQAPGGWAKGLLRQNAEHLGRLRRKVESFRARSLPRTLMAVWALLAWLSVVGVLWPLAVLPGLPQIAVSKKLILTLFGVGVLGFVMYLAYEFWELRRLGQFDWRKR